MGWQLCVAVVIFSIGALECNTQTDDRQLTANDVLFVVRNQKFKRSIEKAELIKESLLSQAEQLKKGTPTVLLMHEHWANKIRNGWTISVLFEHFEKNYPNKKWIFFCEDSTEMQLEGLLNVLAKYSASENWFLGHALYDKEAVVIHHYAFYNDLETFSYPDFDCGWALSNTLAKRVANKIRETNPSSGFSIDVKHELAVFLGNQKGMKANIDRSVNGTFLTHVKEFCINKALGEEGCVTTVRHQIPNCGIVPAEDILIAVKTCEKYHKERVPIVKKTLGLYAKHIRYYSDVVDPEIPTEYIDVQNYESGHCKKLHNIIKRSNEKELRRIPWLVVVDDDTIMSFKRLQRLLACYDSEDMIVMGEKYGFRAEFGAMGYEYPTGGGGMVLSRRAVKAVLNSGCQCPMDDSPDDMWLGLCINNYLHKSVLHTNSFHQAQPLTYNPDFLSHRYLVSFHKHKQADPMEIYEKYLTDIDENIENKIEDEL